MSACALRQSRLRFGVEVPVRTVFVCLILMAGCADGPVCETMDSSVPSDPDFMFPGWEPVNANQALSYCADLGGYVVALPMNAQAISEAQSACALAGQNPCWVGDTSHSEAWVITPDGDLVTVPSNSTFVTPLCGKTIE